MTEPRLPPWFALPSASRPTPAVTIVGAGLAGCSLARELAERAIPSVLLDAGAAVAGAASGNPAGIVKPYVTRDASAITAFYAAAYAALQRRLSGSALAGTCGYTACGVLQLVNTGYAPDTRFAVLDRRQAGVRAGTRVTSTALWFADAGWLNPSALCRALVNHPLIESRCHWRMHSLARGTDTRWMLQAADGRQITAATVVLATGRHLASTPFTRHLPITPARGQIDRYSLDDPSGAALRCVVSGRSYAIPDGEGIIAGASFERDRVDTTVSACCTADNHQALRRLLPAAGVATGADWSRAGVRATTPDRLPMVGPVPDCAGYHRDYRHVHHGRPAHSFAPAALHTGLYVIGGLGSRGIVSAGYCASLLADHLRGCNGPWEQHGMLLHPGRFILRALRRGSAVPPALTR